MDHEATHKAVTTRTARIRRDSAITEADRTSRQLDIVDLIVGGATVRQIADHYSIDMTTVRADYAAGLALLIDRSIDYSRALRDEVTLRQRSLILSNMPRAKAGDRAAAAIIQNSDALLASIWGLRSLRIEPPTRPRDELLSEAVGAYLEGITASTSTNGNGHR